MEKLQNRIRPIAKVLLSVYEDGDVLIEYLENGVTIYMEQNWEGNYEATTDGGYFVVNDKPRHAIIQSFDSFVKENWPKEFHAKAEEDEDDGEKGIDSPLQ